MKNAELWKSYSEYTSEATKQARQLAFGGTAICWFFRSAEVTFPPLIALAMLVFILYFAVDAVQYITAALQLRRWTRGEENRQWNESGTIDGQYDKPVELDAWPFRLFALKLATLFAAFGTLGAELIRRLL